MGKYTELDTMREEIVHRATYHPVLTTIPEMITYTTRLREVLLSEGVECTYIPNTNGYCQHVVVYVGERGCFGLINIHLYHSYSPSFPPDLTPSTEFHTVRELLYNLRAAEVRYWEALHEAFLEEALWKQCRSCYYGGEGTYCGAGLERVQGCLEYTTKSYE